MPRILMTGCALLRVVADAADTDRRLVIVGLAACVGLAASIDAMHRCVDPVQLLLALPQQNVAMVIYIANAMAGSDV